MVQPKNATHPNAARLFAAWFVTEGWKSYMELEGNVAFSRPGSFFLDALKEVGLSENDAVLGGRTNQELRVREQAAAELKKLLP